MEGVIWRRAQRLRRLGHTVDIYNSKQIDEVVATINEHGYDFVDCHNEGFASACTRLDAPYLITNHHGDLHRIAQRDEIPESYQARFRQCLAAPANIVLTERIRDLYVRHGYAGLLRVLPNTVEVDHARCAPSGWRDAISLGKISRRKRQAELADLTRSRVNVDFVGPWRVDKVPEFQENATARYLGSWDRETVLKRLTEYRCFVLLSSSEAAPLVVQEALAAGLNLVLTEACAANLTREEFITVLPDDEARPEVVVPAIQRAIDDNHHLRPSIRAYARERFDEPIGIERYLQIIHDVRARTHLHSAFITNNWCALNRALTDT